MSKAFVKESDDQDDDELDLPQIAGVRNYITPAGHRRLKDELLQLLNTERPEVVKTVSWAASNGDRSENGDYIYGKKRLREIDRRIRFLTKRLDVAEVVDPAAREPTDPNILRRHSALLNRKWQRELCDHCRDRRSRSRARLR